MYQERKLRQDARSGDLESVKLLITQTPNLNPNLPDELGKTAFFYACEQGRVDVVNYFLNLRKPQIDVNEGNIAGVTPLATACFKGNEEIVKVLLDDPRIDVNKSSHTGMTPLHHAVSNSNADIVEMLLAFGRNVDLKKVDDEGLTAIDIARRSGYIWRLLWDYGRNPTEVRKSLRRKLDATEAVSGQMFALTVFLSDGYLTIPDS